MRNKLVKCALLTLISISPLVACDDGGTGPGDGTASLSVYLTDGPGDVENVWVELLSLTAQGGEGGGMELLGEPTGLVLLTELVGQVQLLSVNADLDPTTFRQLRLVVGDVVLEAAGDSIYVKGDPALPPELEPEFVGDLQCPSCSQSGIKVKVPNDEVEVEEGAAAMVLDFVVAQSFGHKAGNSGKWVMHPVILGTLVADENGDGTALDELGLVGSVSGTVALGSGIEVPVCPGGTATPSLQNFVPTATLQGLLDGDGQPIVRSGTVEEDGTFQIGFLPSGTYTMGFVSAVDFTPYQLGFGATPSPAEVLVEAADFPGVAYSIETFTCETAG